MKRKIISSAVLALAASGAFAADFTDTAPVISATPIYERVNEPRQECWTETVNTYSRLPDRSVAGPVLGGVAGAIIGNQVGGGQGRTAATAAGAILGAITGDRLSNPRYAYAPQPRQVQRCRQVDAYRDVVSGYTVVYRYSGHDVTTTLPYDPGSTIRVSVGAIDGRSRHLSYNY